MIITYMADGRKLLLSVWQSRSPTSPSLGGNRRPPKNCSSNTLEKKYGLSWAILRELFFDPARSFGISSSHRFAHVKGHAACAEAGVFGKRGYPLECAAAQVCREAEARVTTNVLVRNMDMAHFDALDSRRLEVVADGLTLWRGAQLAVDTTLVSPLSRNGAARRRAANHDGAALDAARKRKEDTQDATRGVGGRSWWALECRDSRQSSSAECASQPPGQDGGSLVASLECYPGLQRSKVVCRLLAGPQSHARDRQRCALSTRGSEG